MKHAWKQTLALAVCALVCAAATALPGVVPLVPDSSGEYVYYKDNTFQRDSYIGILFYDEDTYALRYYAPGSATDGLLPKSLTVYLRINGAADHMELTGESIEGETEAADADIINYLHDLMYEFTALRQHAAMPQSMYETAPQKAEVLQFGGSVTLYWDSKVPVFNLREIRAADGSQLLVVQTVGALATSADTSFAAFAGLDAQPQDRERPFVSARRAKSQKQTFGTQTITLDSQWEQSMENLWLLGDYALLTMNVIPDASEEMLTVIMRRLCEGTTGSYAVWNHLSVTRKGMQTGINGMFYQPPVASGESANVTRDFVLLTPGKDGSTTYLKLTVFDSVYRANKSYFDKILKSYKVK